MPDMLDDFTVSSGKGIYCSIHGYQDSTSTLRCEKCWNQVNDGKVEGTPFGGAVPLSKASEKAADKLKAANVAADLDPNDPFDKVILKMVEVNRAKRRDYALDGGFDSNFTDVAFNLGIDDFGNVESAYVLLLTKVARIRSLRKNGRMEDPSNESVVDTFVDLANYAVLCLAMIQEKQNGN